MSSCRSARMEVLGAALDTKPNAKRIAIFLLLAGCASLSDNTPPPL